MMIGGWRLGAVLLASGLLAACSDMQVSSNVCDDNYGPGLEAWVQGMDTDGDDRINSDEFNSAFNDAVDQMDGRMTYEGFRQKICSQAPYSH